MTDKIDILVVGSGGREHALAWKLRQSSRCNVLYAAPGNPGIAQVAECVPIPVSDIEAIVGFAVEVGVDLVVVGPEAPLAAGLADRLREAGIRVFGPSAAAARIESSKAYARDLMARAGVPQPEFAHFTELAAAEAYLQRFTGGAVVKADGLAAGKGAVVCDTPEEARETARRMLEDREFGESSAEIVIEERLEGEEVSLLSLTGGEGVVQLRPAQDYKRALDGDQGTNTGGMGCYAPAPVLSPALVDEAIASIILPTLMALEDDGAPFQGCLYAGLMLTRQGLKVIEFNCRFGDPETQVVLPLLDEDLLELFLACAEERLEARRLRWRKGRAVSVVLASGGYPGAYRTGVPIRGLDAKLDDVLVFHAGTAEKDGAIVTAGGRVLNVVGLGETFGAAIDRAYAGVAAIDFEGRQFRTDIAARVREK